MEESIYTWMAVIGCTILVVQVILQVVGLEGDADADVDIDADIDGDVSGHGNLFFGFLSFKALVAFVGIFGLTGLMLAESDMSTGMRALYATLAGFAAMVVVGYMMRALHSLGHSGTLKLTNALGRQGSVYLRIPGSGGGRGKITIEIQGRSVELAAVTDGDDIQTGALVQVVEVLGDETVKVQAV